MANTQRVVLPCSAVPEHQVVLILPQPLMETFLQAPLWYPESAKFSTCRNRAKKERWMMEGTLNSSGFPASGLSRCLPRCVRHSGGFCCTRSCVWGLGKARCFDLTVTDELWKVCKRHEVFLHWIYTKEPDVNLSKWRFSLLHLTTATIFCCSECAAGFKIKNNRGKKRRDLVGSEGGWNSSKPQLRFHLSVSVYTAQPALLE